MKVHSTDAATYNAAALVAATYTVPLPLDCRVAAARAAAPIVCPYHWIIVWQTCIPGGSLRCHAALSPGVVARWHWRT